jgi:hypothetical protein
MSAPQRPLKMPAPKAPDEGRQPAKQGQACESAKAPAPPLDVLPDDPEDQTQEFIDLDQGAAIEKHD